jgi:hypothetical protein
MKGWGEIFLEKRKGFLFKSKTELFKFSIVQLFHVNVLFYFVLIFSLQCYPIMV